MALGSYRDTVTEECVPYTNTLPDKLLALTECLLARHHEDTTRHLCDLLEFCWQRLVPMDGMSILSVVGMAGYYGDRPQEVEE